LVYRLARGVLATMLCEPRGWAFGQVYAELHEQVPGRDVGLFLRVIPREPRQLDNVTAPQAPVAEEDVFLGVRRF
jgi:hypothetical protein